MNVKVELDNFLVRKISDMSTAIQRIALAVEKLVDQNEVFIDNVRNKANEVQ